MATKAEVAEILRHAWGMMLADPLDEIGFDDLAHLEVDDITYLTDRPHVFEVNVDGETYKIAVSKPRKRGKT